MTPKPQWEMEFDRNYEPLGDDEYNTRWKYGAPSPLSLKRFISSVIHESYQQGVEDEKKRNIDEIGKMFETIRPDVDRMKSKYPKELNIEGLEPALTNDIAEIVQKHVEDMRRKCVVNVGMLRQWLNEDRITDTKRLVTNEDIEHWLNYKTN